MGTEETQKPGQSGATVRLLGAQVATALRSIGENRADVRTLDKEVETLKIEVAVLKTRDEKETCEGCQALEVKVARLSERATLVVEILAAIQILGIAIAAYLGSR